MPAAPLVSLGSNYNVPGLQSAHEPETEEPQTEEPETQESGTHENSKHHHLLTPSAIGIGTGLYCALLPFWRGETCNGCHSCILCGMHWPKLLKAAQTNIRRLSNRNPIGSITWRCLF